MDAIDKQAGAGKGPIYFIQVGCAAELGEGVRSSCDLCVRETASSPRFPQIAGSCLLKTSWRAVGCGSCRQLNAAIEA